VGSLIHGGRLPVWAHHPGSGSNAHEPERREVNMPIPDFSLTDQQGEPFEFKVLKDQIVLLTFVYTTCPDVCPLVTVSMRSVQKDLSPKERESVYLLSVTTDPEIDKPEILKSYGERHQVDFTNWSLLTGNIQQLAFIWKAFGIKVLRKARGLVSHTSLTALMDKKGVVRIIYTGTAPDAKVILKDLRMLLGSG
jgi:protein SCO1/2